MDNIQLWLEGVAGLNHSAVRFSPLKCKKMKGKKYGLDDKSTPRPIRHMKGCLKHQQSIYNNNTIPKERYSLWSQKHVILGKLSKLKNYKHY